MAELEPSNPQWRQKAASTEQAMDRATAASQRKAGVTIGMSPESVLASNWGKPRSVSRRSTAMGTRETWVYPGGTLHFEDGRLIAIDH